MAARAAKGSMAAILGQRPPAMGMRKVAARVPDPSVGPQRGRHAASNPRWGARSKTRSRGSWTNGLGMSKVGQGTTMLGGSGPLGTAGPAKVAAPEAPIGSTMASSQALSGTGRVTLAAHPSEPRHRKTKGKRALPPCRPPSATCVGVLLQRQSTFSLRRLCAASWMRALSGRSAGSPPYWCASPKARSTRSSTIGAQSPR
mmetsp:Transcript_9458/g.21686  ORF Transcript_9458/g.21686 Transcript_9458/m.21686 type:complete len:201 (+) Transcript_9458:45-647(+)